MPVDEEGGAGHDGSASGIPMAEKVVRLHEVLDKHGIPHAFGGAIAVDYYRVPRATIDIDLNLFIPPQEHARAIEALGELFAIPDRDAIASEVAEREQGKVHWAETRIDLFFAASNFHASMAKRAHVVDYQATKIPILSAEDIITIKAVFDRSQDWADIEAVFKLLGDGIDLAYVTHWLDLLVGSDDPRVDRVRRLAGEA